MIRIRETCGQVPRSVTYGQAAHSGDRRDQRVKPVRPAVKFLARSRDRREQVYLKMTLLGVRSSQNLMFS